MKILNIGSINLDHVYTVDHFVRPGETIASSRYQIFPGGKGFNQSVALARAGAPPIHAGRIGPRDEWLVQRLRQEGVDASFVRQDDVATGHAIIQVVPSGENAIVLFGGANLRIVEADVAAALDACSPGDVLMLQNETSSVAHAMEIARRRELKVVFNPAPMSSDVHQYPLEAVRLFILNETEAEGLTGKTRPEEIRSALCKRFPRSATVLTLGDQGAYFFDDRSMLHEPALPVVAVDSTAAGDTFIGYFLAEWLQSANPAAALSLGCRAAAICVTRPGASDSIPFRHELQPSAEPIPPSLLTNPANRAPSRRTP